MDYSTGGCWTCLSADVSGGELREQRGNILLIALIISVIAVLIGLTWANYRFAQQNPGGNDFLARWMGAHYWVVDGISPYDERVSLASQQAIYGHPADISQGEDKNHFVYPLHSMLFFAPFGPLDYTLARALWMTLLEVSLFLLAIVSIRLADWRVSPLKSIALILFTLLWYHGVRTVIIGQFAGLNALIIALALLLIMRKQDFVAGTAFSAVHRQAADGFLAAAIHLTMGDICAAAGYCRWDADRPGSSTGRFPGVDARLAPPVAAPAGRLSVLHQPHWLASIRYRQLHPCHQPPGKYLFSDSHPWLSVAGVVPGIQKRSILVSLDGFHDHCGH